MTSTPTGAKIWQDVDLPTLNSHRLSSLSDTEQGANKVSKAQPTEIDEAGVKAVTKQIEEVKAAGLTEAAATFETVYWGWLRMTSAYVHGHPYVAKPEDGMTPISALHVVDFTLAHWGPQIPGTPSLNDEAVLIEAAADDAWHRGEDRRMRREYGEEI